MSISHEAQSRKERSIDRLRREGVPFIEHLPVIQDSTEMIMRSADEIALRAIAVVITAIKGETRDQALVTEIVRTERADLLFTPQERAFFDDPRPDNHQCTQFSWRYEALGVLLWAIGYVPQLCRPDCLVDVQELVAKIGGLGRDAFVAGASLRSPSELLDEADLIYRYAWATREAALQGRPPPAGLDPGVVIERHYTLNWLVTGEYWDDVDTST